MSHTSHKIGGSHLQRAAFVYIRQSSVNQIEHNRESIQRQYALAQRAVSLGWHKQQVSGVGEDLGLSGARAAHRGGFARMTSEVALGHVALSSGWKFPAWRAITPTGIAYSICVAWPILLLETPTACTTRRRSMTGCCLV